MKGTVIKFNYLQSKEKSIKPEIQKNIKQSVINQSNKDRYNQLFSTFSDKKNILVITESYTSENKKNQENNKQKENISYSPLKFKDQKPSVNTNQRNIEHQNKIIKFNSSQHTNTKDNILITQPPKIKREGIITHIQPPSVIKASTMKHINTNPQKLFKICQQDVLDNLFLKSKESIIRNAKVVQVQDLNDSLNFWKEFKK